MRLRCASHSTTRKTTTQAAAVSRTRRIVAFAAVVPMRHPDPRTSGPLDLGPLDPGTGLHCARHVHPCRRQSWSVKVFTGRYGFGGGLTIPNYSVSPDGTQFFMLKEQSRAIL